MKTEEEVKWEEEGAGEDFRMFCELLKGNAIPTKKLSLQIGDKGARMMSNALKTNSTLTLLDLSRNEKAKIKAMYVTNESNK